MTPPVEALRACADEGTPPLHVTTAGALCSVRRHDGSPLSVTERVRVLDAMTAAVAAATRPGTVTVDGVYE